MKKLFSLFGVLSFLVGGVTFAASAVPDIDGLTATSGNTSATLSWSAPSTTASGSVIGNYKVYFGTKSAATTGGIYANEILTNATKTTYTISNLINGTPYYFAVTALDAAGNESVNYSPEATTTPKASESEATTSAFHVLSAKALDTETVEVTFSSPVQLPKTAPKSAVSLTDKKTGTTYLSVKKVETASGSTNIILLTTEPQNANTTYVFTAGIGITDASGKPIVSGNSDTATFVGSATPHQIPTTTGATATMTGTTTPTSTSTQTEPLHGAAQTTGTSATVVDTTPPENVTGFRVSFKTMVDTFLIKMGWKASADTAKDLADQRLYESTDAGTTYSAAESLGKEVVAHEKSVPQAEYAGKEVTYKLTTVDAVGNESTGAIKTIRLPQTGPELLFLLGLLGSGAAAEAMRRRKK